MTGVIHTLVTESLVSVQSPFKLSNGQNQVVRRLHHVILPPNLAHVVIPHLTSSSKEFVAGGPNGVHRKSRTHSFFEIDEEGFLKIPAGLLPRVVEACEQQGIPVSVIDRSRWPLLEQLTAQLPDIVTDEDRSLLSAVAANPRGRIVAHGRDHFELVILICRAFADARVLIVTINRKQRDRLLAKLRFHLSRPVSSHDGIEWGACDRITAITASFFAGIGRRNNDFDAILFVGPETVTGEQAFETASQLTDEMMYCIEPPSCQRDELTQLRLEATCGTVIFDAVETGASVQVVMLATPSTFVPAKITQLERKRGTIWHNDQRNDLIAEIALGIASQNVSTFSLRSKFSSEHIELLSLSPHPGIAILVESIEHGIELQRRLPGWELLTAVADDDGALESGTCHRSIITQAFASLGIYTDILIRATGTSSPLVVKGFPSIAQRRAIVLFDLLDDFDSQAIGNTQARIRDYKARGWTVIGGAKWSGHRNDVEATESKNKPGARA